MRALDLRGDRDHGVDERLRRGRPEAVPMPHHDEHSRRDRLGGNPELDARVVLIDRQQRRQGDAQA
jgi:hypothetical protein